MNILFIQIAHAASAAELLNAFMGAVVKPVIGVLFAFAFMLFLWGILEFFWDGGDAIKNEKGRKHMLYGVLGMFIMVSVNGIIALLQNTIYTLQ